MHIYIYIFVCLFVVLFPQNEGSFKNYCLSISTCFMVSAVLGPQVLFFPKLKTLIFLYFQLLQGCTAYIFVLCIFHFRCYYGLYLINLGVIVSQYPDISKHGSSAFVFFYCAWICLLFFCLCSFRT